MEITGDLYQTDRDKDRQIDREREREIERERERERQIERQREIERDTYIDRDNEKRRRVPLPHRSLYMITVIA